MCVVGPECGGEPLTNSFIRDTPSFCHGWAVWCKMCVLRIRPFIISISNNIFLSEIFFEGKEIMHACTICKCLSGNHILHSASFYYDYIPSLPQFLRIQLSNLQNWSSKTKQNICRCWLWQESRHIITNPTAPLQGYSTKKRALLKDD